MPESYEKVHEVILDAECGRQVAWKMLSSYVDGKLQVPIRFDTDRTSVSDPSDALFLEWMRRYITDVMLATDDEVIRSLAAVYGALSAPNYSANGAGSSSEASDVECNRFEWLVLARRHLARLQPR